MYGDYNLVYEIATEYAELAGIMNTKLDDRQMGVLLKAADSVWTSVNTHTAIKLFAKLRDAVGEQNRTDFAERLIDHLRITHADFSERISLDAAGQLLQGLRS